MPHHPKSIALHIGAHKTATTHLQQSLQASELMLSNCGVRYFGPPSLRDDGDALTDRFNLKVTGALRGKKSGLTPAEQLAKMSDGADRLILSDENFIGLLQTKSGEMARPMYPRAAERIAALADAVAVAEFDVFVGVRNPTGFLTSAYSQLLMGGDALPFNAYLERNPLQTVYWPGLVARVVLLPQVRSVTVWRQEDYSEIFEQICSGLTGGACSVEPQDAVVHRGLSAKAVQSTLETFERTGEQGAGKIARDVYPVNQIYAAFAPFDGETIRQSEQEYQNQLADIAGLQGVSILRP